jgi:curved DNA-binding protein CbpA
MSDAVIVTRDVGRRAENLIVAGGSGTVLKGVELLLHENIYVPGTEAKVGPTQMDCSGLLKKGLNLLQAMPFDLLGLDLNSATVDVRKAYKKLALKYHPDKNPRTTPIFQLIQNIQTKLSDSTEREKVAQQVQQHKPHRKDNNAAAAAAAAAAASSVPKDSQAKPNFPPPKPANPFAQYSQAQQQYQQYSSQHSSNQHSNQYSSYDQSSKQQYSQQQHQQSQQQYPYNRNNPFPPQQQAYQQYQQQQQQRQQQANPQQQHQQQQDDSYRRKNYYEELLREQYRKAAEAEKRAKEYANKFHEDIFSDSEKKKPSYPSSGQSNAYNSYDYYKSQQPQPSKESYSYKVNNPTSSTSSSSSSTQSQQQYSYPYNKYNPNDASSAVNHQQASSKYTTGQTYRTTADGNIYPQQSSSKSHQQAGGGSESSKYSYAYNPAGNGSQQPTHTSSTNSSDTAGEHIHSSSSTSSKSPMSLVPRPFAFRLVSKTSSMVELEWKTSSLHNCPLAVELSWKDHSKSTKSWEMSSKVIHSGCCRKKNLTPLTTYEFRVRCVEEYSNGKFGNKSDWTEPVVVLMPASDLEREKVKEKEKEKEREKTATNAAEKGAPSVPKPSPSMTPDEQFLYKMKKQQEEVRKQQEQKQTQQQSSLPKKDPIGANAQSRSRSNSRDDHSRASHESETNAPSKSPLKFRRFDSRFGVAQDQQPLQQEGQSSNKPKKSPKASTKSPKGGKKSHFGNDDGDDLLYMKKDVKNHSSYAKFQKDLENEKEKEKEKEKLKERVMEWEKEKEREKSSLTSPPSFLSASAKLAWTKESLAKGNNGGKKEEKVNLSIDLHDDVTYLEIDEDLDDPSDNEKDQKKAGKVKHHKEDSDVDNESAAEVDEEDEEAAEVKSQAPNTYRDDFEMFSESEGHNHQAHVHPLPHRQPMQQSQNLEKSRQTATPSPHMGSSNILDDDGDEIDSEYTDSDGGSSSGRTHHLHSNNLKKKEASAAKEDAKGNSNTKPPRPKQSATKAATSSTSSLHTMNKLDVSYGSESEGVGSSSGGLEIDEEKIFLLYPPKDDHSHSSHHLTDNGKRVYRHPVHKEPFLKSEIKGYLLADQNVIACANCGDWLRVKLHIPAKNTLRPISNSEEDWGWCLRKDKNHSYLKMLEGKKKANNSSSSTPNLHSNPPSVPSTARSVIPDNSNKSDNGSSGKTSVGTSSSSVSASQATNNKEKSGNATTKAGKESKTGSANVINTNNNQQKTSSSASAGITSPTNSSFRSPPPDKGLRRNPSSNLLNQSLRNIPRPVLVNQNQQQQVGSKASSSNNKQPSSTSSSTTSSAATKQRDSSSSSAAAASSASNHGPVDEWIECFDEHGNVYYFNEKTSESKWEPPEWFEESDPITGSKYYIHVVMNGDDIQFQSTWEKPKVFSRVIHAATA